MLSAGNGFIMQSVKYSRDNAGQSLKKYILLNQGELAYNHGASKAKQFGCCYELTEPEARIPYVYHCFKVSDTEYTPFVAATLNNPKMDKQLKRLVSSSVRMDGLLNISFDDYMSVSLHLPSFAEQKKIADFLKKLDERITAQEMLMTSLKKYKRGAIKSLFTQELTLAENTTKWERHKLSDLITLQSGQDFAPSDYNDHGEGIPYMTGASCIVDGKTVVSRWTTLPRCFAYYGDTLLVCKGSGSGAVVMLSQDKVHIGPPKTKTSARTIPVPSLLMNIIKKFYTDNPNHYFLTGKTKPTEPRTYRQFFTRFLKRNGLQKVKFHEIRHTFAVRAIEIPEFDIKSLSEILGHKNVSFTLNVYGSANLQQKVKCMNLLNDLL